MNVADRNRNMQEAIKNSKIQPNIKEVRRGSSARIQRIKGKTYDFKTKNKSFLKLARDLKTLGVHNFYFMLELNDISLINVDPFAVDEHGHTLLSKDQIMRIMAECAVNPWYFLREISRIPDQGGTSIPYLANRGNIAQAWCIYHGIDSWLSLPRQRGKTQSALAFQVWMYIFGTTNSTFIQVNKDGDNAKENLRRMNTQINLLPEYLQCKSIPLEDGKVVKAKENATLLGNPINNNKVITKSKATSYETALSLARGLTAPILHFDESEFTNHIKTIVSNSVSTYATAAANAKRNHAMYARIFTSTPGDLDTAPGVEAQEILDKTAKWTERLYDMNQDEIEDWLSKQGEDFNGILYIEYSYKQLGLTNEWFKEISAMIGDILTVRREILLQRLHGSSLSPYPQEDMDYIASTIREPIEQIPVLDYYYIDVYTKLNPKIPYLIGVDCSTGTTSDNNAFTILDPYKMEPVAEFQCNFIGETMYERVLLEVHDMLPRAVFCIERNSMGDGIIDHLLHSKMAGRLYFDKNRDLQAETMQHNESVESLLKKEAKNKTYYGVYTSGSSRDTMFAILGDHVARFKDKFITKRIIEDLTRLIRKPTGRIEAGPGFHDDSIMSYLIALYVYKHGNNLLHFGINKDELLPEDENKGLTLSPEEIDPSLVDPSLINAVKDMAKKESMTMKENDWDAMLAQAIEKSQKETYKLHKSGMIDNTIFDDTPAGTVDDWNGGGSIPMSFFTQINSMNNMSQNGYQPPVDPWSVL